jgi:hypothetical protein
MTSEQRKLFEERFEHVIKGYEDDDIGELDDEHPSAHGNLDLSHFDDVFDDFIEKHKHLITIATPAVDTEEAETRQKTKATTKAHDGGYVSEEEEKEFVYVEDEEDEGEQWDCQSIISK